MEKHFFNFFHEINYGIEDRIDGKNYRYWHSQRVVKLSLEIAGHADTSENVDESLIFLLALFHDIGKNEKLVRENNLFLKEHDANNIFLFEKYLYPFLKDEKLTARLRLVTLDFSRKKYELPESRIVRDADNLDEIGILNFWRMASYAGKHHADVWESTEYYFAIDRQNKIDKMQGLFFEYSRKIFDERLREMDGLVRRFQEVAVVDIRDME
jgi:HD superfamily phosphodiesterase